AIPTITANGSILTSSSAATYQWYKNGDPIVGATNATYTATANGVYMVRITDANACFYQYSAGYRVSSFPNSISTIDLTKQSGIYPNPTQGQIHILNNQLFGRNTEIVVYNGEGKLVYSSLNTEMVDLSYLPNGLYFMHLRGESGKATYKVQIQH
ncbi:MAG: T9SS type A sorting domain-containing protein, partial [Chitinophagaceae bacterium]|nr:T9SS type A sorting domain-containing protein [Chitinophagaceae bacterium]